MRASAVPCSRIACRIDAMISWRFFSPMLIELAERNARRLDRFINGVEDPDVAQRGGDEADADAALDAEDPPRPVRSATMRCAIRSISWSLSPAMAH